MKRIDPVTAYVVHRLREWMAEDPKNRTQVYIASKAKVSGAQISNLLGGTRGAGRETLRGIAELLGTSWAALEAEALAWAARQGAKWGRTPNRDEAVRIARNGGIEERAIADVINESIEVDNPTLWWLERMRYREILLRAQSPIVHAAEPTAPRPKPHQKRGAKRR